MRHQHERTTILVTTTPLPPRKISEIIQDIKNLVTTGRWHTIDTSQTDQRTVSGRANKLLPELNTAIALVKPKPSALDAKDLVRQLNQQAAQASNQASKHNRWVMWSWLGAGLGAMGGALGLPNAKWPGLDASHLPNSEVLALFGLIIAGTLLGALVVGGGTSYVAGKQLGAGKTSLAKYPEYTKFAALCEQITALDPKQLELTSPAARDFNNNNNN